MASIPSNGYNEVMSGTNNYTGSNSFDGDCPQTPIPPTVPNDLTNKQYVDTLVGPPSGVGLGQILTVSNNGTTQDITNVKTYDTTSPASGGSSAFNGTYRARALGFGSDRIVEVTGYGIGRPASSWQGDLNIANLYPSQNITLETTNTVAFGGLKGRVDCLTALVPYSIVDRTGSQGTDGQVLVSRGTGAPFGSFNPINLEWQSIAAGGVTSVSGGTNVAITGTPAAPVVNLRNPLTAELNVGTQSLRDSAGAVGTSGQILTAGTGGQTLWSAPAASVTSITAGTNIDITGTSSVPIVGLDSPLSATLDVGSQTISSTTSAINLTPLAGQDVNLNVSNAGALHTVQTSAGGTAQPIARFNNSSASVGAVTIRTNKTGRNVASNEVIASVQFNARNFSAVDTTFGKIECSATTATVGDTDGSLDFYSLINGVNNLVFRLNGADNENNSFRPFDLNGNNLKTSSGNMTIDTTASSGTGTLAITSKAATTITSTVSGINLTANGAGTIQLNTPSGALSTTTNSISMVATTQGVFNIPTELHYGKITTPYTNQIYRPVYQPVLTTSPHTLPVAELGQEGHQVILVNSGGDGSNELVTIPTTFFTPTCMELLQIVGIDYYVAGGYNHIQGRAEIRFSTNINGLNTDITSGFFQYVSLQSGQRINCLCYDPVLIPDRIAFGGFFSATAAVTEYRPSLTYPSNVSNILVLDITNYATIAPISMADPSPNFPFTGVYGVDGEVYCCGTRAYDNALYYPPATAPFYIFGGGFGQLLGGGAGLPAYNQINFIPNGSFLPPDIKWFEFGGANQPITMIVNDDAGRIAMGGAFSTIGVSNVDYLAYSDSGLLATTTWQPFASSVPPSVPTEAVTAGKATFGWLHTAFTSGTTFLLGDGGFNNNVYEADLNNHTAGLTILKSAFPSTPRGFAIDLANPTTRYVVGFSTSGGNDYCWDFLTPHFLDLNGSVYMANTFFEVLAIPNLPLFFKSGIEAPNAPLQYSIETPASAGNIVINSTTALPFINPAAPTLKYDRITLATYNNFAMGTLVGYGTDDARILITNSVGATFSNQ